MKTIRELRTEAGMTQRDVASALNVTTATVYLWEQQQVEPRATQVRELAKLFKVAMDDIIFEPVNKKDRHRDKAQ